MSRDGSVSFGWADGEQTFRLAIGQLCELQEKRNVGPDWVLKRLCDGTWRVDDVTETIRIGLIGGGTPRRDAHALVERYAIPNFIGNAAPAIKILLAGLEGAPDEAPKRPAPGGGKGLAPLPNGKWRFAIFYADGAVMGLGADTINRMSVWQFLAAQGGFERQTDGSADPGLSDEEFRELSEFADS